MKDRTFITIPIENRYYGRAPFKIGKILKLTKDPSCERDSEAIKVSIPGLDLIGYVGNSINYVYGGTISAGRLYDRFDDYIYAMVVFVTRASVIASILEKDEVDGKDTNELEDLSKGKINRFCTED